MLQFSTSSGVSSSYSEFRVFSTLPLYNFHILAQLICENLCCSALRRVSSSCCRLVSVGPTLGRRNAFQHSFIVLLPVGSQNVDPSRASGQVKWARCTICACAHVSVQRYTHTKSSVTLQNPCIGYLETGVEFLIHISEALVIEPEVHCWPVLEGCLL